MFLFAEVGSFTLGCNGSIRYWVNRFLLRAVPEIILGGGPAGTFCPVGGGCFVDNVSEGWGVEGNLSWGSRHI